MKNVIRLSIIAALVLVGTPSIAAEPITPDLIKGTSLFEGYGAATHIGPRRLFAWSNEIGELGRLAGYVEVNGGSLTRISPDRTSAYIGGFDQGTERVIYQEVDGDESDLFMYDIGAGERTALTDLNDGLWQWSPSIDTHDRTTWIVYGVNRFGSPEAMWRFYLYNATTGERTLLDETTNRCGCLFPGTIAYPWVTWAVGDEANAWRYDIRTAERAPLLPTERDEYGVAVAPDGTAYVAQGGDSCGVDAALYRVDPDGTPFLLYEFGDDREGANLSLDTTGPHDRLYFDRRHCRTGGSDIWRLRPAERIGEPATPERGANGSRSNGSRRSAASPDASPRRR